MRTKQLSDNLILVRPYTMDDVDALYEAARESIKEVGPWLAWCHENYTRDDAATWLKLQVENWKKSLEFQFAVFERQSDRFLGGCGLNQFDTVNRGANLGYWIRAASVRRGYATAAARLVARFGFEQVKLERIEIVAAVGNRASQRVATKLGAVREGISRGRLRLKDAQCDAVVFSLVRQDIL